MRPLSVGLLVGATLALTGASWWGIQLRSELAARDAIIDRLADENRDLRHDQQRTRQLEVAFAELNQTSLAQRTTIQRLMDLHGSATAELTTVRGQLAGADRRRLEAMVVMDRLVADQAAQAPVAAAVLAGPAKVTKLTAALDRALADRASAEMESTALSAKAASLEAKLDDLSKELEATKESFQAWAAHHYGALKGVLKTSGVRVDPLVKLASAEMEGEGGPFVPLAPGDEHAGRSTLVPLPHELDASFRAVDTMRRLLVALPLGIPAPDAETRSGFGIRRDPFTGRRAMHTGLDFTPGSSGQAFATAPGIVVSAGRRGAYGNLVEIDHGFGLTTRYAHLASIDVKVGQQVAQGTEVGQIGTTGRSTGRHLHYEIRVDGKAVDPADFLEARVRLAHVLSQE
ncbi:M23 family metallopeptidase [Geminicoccus roseus]|uniref:M23 family metallopeptidase n=1 Tax=Geminicoccus roseus TaxID=404900 RepID=UPI0003F55073|nr:M23 family metallopeptidase [Geminicoccus roseus]